jgi:hypothetical protein
MAWFKRFYDPIVLPDGRTLLTLRDAAEYITALPKAGHDAAARQACTAAARLLDVLSVHRGTPDLRHADGPLRLRQGEDAKEGAKEGTQEDAQEDTQEDARLTLLHRLPRRHDLDLRRLAATADEITLTISGGIIFSRFAFAGPLQT